MIRHGRRNGQEGGVEQDAFGISASGAEGGESEIWLRRAAQ